MPQWQEPDIIFEDEPLPGARPKPPPRADLVEDVREATGWMPYGFGYPNAPTTTHRPQQFQPPPGAHRGAPVFPEEGFTTNPSRGAGGIEETRIADPFMPAVQSWQLQGQFDAYAAVVVATYYDLVGGHPTLHDPTAVDCARAIIWHDEASNKQIAKRSGHPFGEPTPTVVACQPFTAKADQPWDIVKVGDIVTVVSGRDGRCYFFRDDDSFIGQVVLNGTATEDNDGGAGLNTLTVRRKTIYGTNDKGVTIGDMTDHAGANIDYAGVLCVKPSEMAHGYRCGDYVLVTRRGWAFFVSPARETFPAKITAHVSDATYTVEELSPAIGNTLITKSAVDPSGSGGVYRRSVDAINLSGSGSVIANDTVVIVYQYAVETSDIPYYCFQYGAGAAVEFGLTTSDFGGGVSIEVDPCDVNGASLGLAAVELDLPFNWPVPVPTPSDIFELPILQGTQIRFMRYSSPRGIIVGVVVGLPAADYGWPYTMLADASTSELTPQIDTWTRNSPPDDGFGNPTRGVVYSGTRVVYDATLHIYYQFGRPCTHDSYGGLAYIGAEVKTQIIDLVNCSTVT